MMHQFLRLAANSLCSTIVVCAALTAGPARADIYGFVDEKGISHLSNVPLDHRHYLRDLLDMFNNNLGLALAAYNAGESAVIKNGNRIPPYAETRRYVPSVIQHYHLYSGR